MGQEGENPIASHYLSVEFFIMSKRTLSNQERRDLLSAADSDDNKYLSDLNKSHFGENRRGEIMAKIGDTGQDFEKLYNDYLESL